MRRSVIYQLLLAVIVVTAYAHSVQAQTAIENSKSSIAEPKVIDSKLVTESAINKYEERLSLSTEQRSVFTEIISGFIEEKLKILPLMQSNRIDYDAKQASYFSTLRNKLANILLRPQLKKFMQLKPRSSEQESALYYIYY